MYINYKKYCYTMFSIQLLIILILSSLFFLKDYLWGMSSIIIGLTIWFSNLLILILTHLLNYKKINNYKISYIFFIAEIIKIIFIINSIFIIVHFYTIVFIPILITWSSIIFMQIFFIPITINKTIRIHNDSRTHSFY